MKSTAVFLPRTPLNQTAVGQEEIRKKIPKILTAPLIKYRDAKLDYKNTEKEIISFIQMFPSKVYSSLSIGEAAFLVKKYRRDYEALKEALDGVLKAYKTLNIPVDVFGEFLVKHSCEYVRNFFDETEHFGSIVSEITIISGCCQDDKERFNNLKIEFDEKLADVEAAISSCMGSGWGRETIYISKINDVAHEIKNKLLNMVDSYKQLSQVYFMGAGVRADEMSDVDARYYNMLAVSNEFTSEYKKIKSCVNEDNVPDYVALNFCGKTIVFEYDVNSKVAHAKIPYVGVYRGGWLDDNAQGRGSMVYDNGQRYDGEWRAGRRHGSGEMVTADGGRYQGKWVAGVQEGEELWYNRDGIKIYQNIRNEQCIGIGESEENLDCCYQLMLGATGGVRRGYVEAALHRWAKKIEVSSASQDFRLVEYARYHRNMCELMEQVRKWIVVDVPQRRAAWNSFLKNNGDGLFFCLSLGSHVVNVEMLPPKSEGGRYAVTVFNSGKGLNYHNSIDNGEKYEVRLTAYFDVEKINFIERLFIYDSVGDVDRFYKSILNEKSKDPPSGKDAQPEYDVVFQAPQISGNCCLECWMAVFKNKAVQMYGQSGVVHYMRFRNDLLKHLLDTELKKSESSSRDKGVPTRDMNVISRVQQRTIKRIEKIISKMPQPMSEVEGENIFVQNAIKLYPGELEKQRALLTCIESENLKDNLKAINSVALLKSQPEAKISGAGWSLNEVMLASAFSKIVKRNLEILELESAYPPGTESFYKG